jgi:hypothetical protein
MCQIQEIVLAVLAVPKRVPNAYRDAAPTGDILPGEPPAARAVESFGDVHRKWVWNTDSSARPHFAAWLRVPLGQDDVNAGCLFAGDLRCQVLLGRVRSEARSCDLSAAFWVCVGVTARRPDIEGG